MTEDGPSDAADAFDRHDAFEALESKGSRDDRLPASGGERASDDGGGPAADDGGQRDEAGRAAPAADRTGGKPAAHAVTTTRFDARVRAEAADGPGVRYVVTVRVPMLSTATQDEVGPAVEAGWFETLERRLADATMATRDAVTLDEYALAEEAGTAVARFAFVHESPDGAADVAKTLAEYVEGTYVEGVVPGYEYEERVRAVRETAHSQGGTPL